MGHEYVWFLNILSAENIISADEKLRKALVSFEDNWKNLSSESKNHWIDSGMGSWWEFTGDGTSGNPINPKNITNVISCFCNNHPLPQFPPFNHDSNGKTQDVLLAGVPRSGNTVTYQVLNSLHHGKVIRIHGFGDSCPLLYTFKKIVVTIRNPYDVAYSLSRMGWYSQNKNKKIWDDVMRFTSFSRFQQFMDYRPDLKIVYIKYEEVWDKPNARASYLANFLEKQVTSHELEKIVSNTSIEKNAKRAKFKRKQKDLGEMMIHPQHVGPAKGNPGQGKLLDSKIRKEVLKTCEWAFEAFEYEK